MELLTLSEIAKELDQPESTIRSWRNRYDSYLPSQGKGRKRRYGKDLLPVFKRIAELAAEGLRSDDVAERLGAGYDSDHCFDGSSPVGALHASLPATEQPDYCWVG